MVPPEIMVKVMTIVRDAIRRMDVVEVYPSLIGRRKIKRTMKKAPMSVDAPRGAELLKIAPASRRKVRYVREFRTEFSSSDSRFVSLPPARSGEAGCFLNTSIITLVRLLVFLEFESNVCDAV
jgi:hypothetical protein